MPFGSVFGAIVFGILGTVLGTRMIGTPGPPFRVMGACLALLGVTVGAGLLMKKSWARWFGVFAGLWFAGSAATSFLAQGDVFHLTVVLAAFAAAVLLVIPATGRPVRDPSALAEPPSNVSRALLSGACLAIAGFVGATVWAVARIPAPATEPVRETAQGTAPGKAPAPVHAPAKDGPVAWLDFADGLKEAKSSQKLVVADFYATWCGPCKMMEKRTFHDPRVLARLRDVIPVRVDSEESHARGGLRGDQLALRYAIESYPTLVVLDATGHEVARNVGFMDADQFLEWIDSVIEKAGTTLARS